MNRPNILFLFTDQQRWDALGVSGNPHIQTPNLDALAACGVLFEHAFCNAPVCMPSRHSVFSGQYPSATGLTANGIEMPRDLPTLPVWLKAAGYETANIGKLHFTNHASRDHAAPHPKYGFDELILSDEPGCYDDAYLDWLRRKFPDDVEACRCSTPPECSAPPLVLEPRNVTEPYLFRGPDGASHSAFVADVCGDFLRRERDRPFFLVAGFYAPHTPLNPPASWVEKYDIGAMPLPHMNEGENKFGLSDDAWRKVKAYYYALTSHVDEQVGRLFRVLEETGQRENTLIVFTSDHGEHLGDHGQIQKGPPGLESCTRVPLLVAGPGIEPGQRRAELAELVDLAPTFLDYAGAPLPEALSGQSLRPLLEGGEGNWKRDAALTEHHVPGGANWKTVRTRTHRYCRNQHGAELLFDLQADPHELRNLAAEPAAASVLAAMRERLPAARFDADRPPRERTGKY